MKEEVINRNELKALLEYSCSFPTGTTIGKRWSRRTRYEDVAGSDWMIGEYVEHPDPEKVGIKWVWAVSEPGIVYRGEL